MEGVIIAGITSLFNVTKYSGQIVGQHIGLSGPAGPAPEFMTPAFSQLQKESVLSKLSTKDKPSTSLDRITSMLYIILWIGLGITAAYLSFDSNTVVGWNIFYKIIFAIGAFLFPFYYLFIHFVSKYDLLRLVRS